jgi:predicted HTH transcriptional regulator
VKIQFENQGDAIVTLDVEAGEEPIAVELMRDFLGVKSPRKNKPRKQANPLLTERGSEYVEFVKKFESVNAQNLADEFGISRSNASAWLAGLTKQGILRRVERGQYAR